MLDTWLSMPTFKPKRDMRIVRDAGGEIVAVATVDNRAPHISTHSEGHVALSRLGEGIGSHLLSWALAEARGRIDQAPEGARVYLGTEADPRWEPSVSLLTDAGFAPMRYFLEMRIDFAGEPPEPEIPDGIRLESFDPKDLEPVFDATTEAFRDHFGHVDRPRDEDLEWFRRFVRMPSVDQKFTYVAWDGDEIAGANICLTDYEGDDAVGYVASLSVRRPWRGRGLAKAMLRACFSDFARHGKTAATLHVDAENITGATRLYEAVGMRETHRMGWYELELRAGEELSVR